MKLNDVIELTKSAIAQAMGTEYMASLGDLKAMDSYKLVDVGRDVTDSGNVEKFTNALISLIGKLDLDLREYTGKLKYMYVESFEWGGFVERVRFGLADVMSDPMWNLTPNQSYADIEHTFYRPEVQANIFEEGKAIMIPISIQKDVLKEAFHSWENLNSFISGIRVTIHNTLEVMLDSYAHMLISSGIATSVNTNALNNAVHLITLAVEEGVEGVTLETTPLQALNNPTFLAFALEKIAEVKSNMSVMSTAYNNGIIPTFDNSPETVLLSYFDRATRMRLKADTFNENLLSIGDYNTVVAWQGVKGSDGKSFKFDTISKIEISADVTNKLGLGQTAVTVSNVIGVVHDRRAMGICPFKQKMSTSYTACADFWNEFHHTLVNYLLDTSYGIVAFVLD